MLVLHGLEAVACPLARFPGRRGRIPCDIPDFFSGKFLTVFGKGALTVFSAVNSPALPVDRGTALDVLKGLLRGLDTAFGLEQGLLNSVVDGVKLFLNLPLEFEIFAPCPFSRGFL
jgi:hypothetical protein